MIDENQLCEWIDRYGNMLLRVCYLYLHDAALAEDAVQETFLKAWEKRNMFQGKSSEKSWLTAIAMNTCRDMLRSMWFKHVDRHVTPEDLPQGGTGEEKDDSITVELMNLPEKIRKVMVMYYYVGMHTEEIAQVFDISRSAVIMRLKRGREKLKTLLTDQEGNGNG